MNDIERELVQDLQDFVVDLAGKVFDGVTMRTPVKTGQTRKSWNMTKHEADGTTVDEGTGLPPPSKPNISFGPDEYPLIVVANGKPHIEMLEAGSSRQAPNGMVAVTLAGL